ncbi:DUF4097 family beta strand repeat-containing protein [Salinimonas lutimaris]|uniref:DUF4097 family beta strand repeat-containing protein n=1 Tax=Salinimonas lutimaris TaxID=914153 RepID=UPI0010C14154|nr:DUF4097 family beta strand repeat protein [Salinimonas lutimaris]
MTSSFTFTAKSFLLGSVLLSHLALAGQPINKELETSGSPNVEIEHVNGEAIIKTWDKSAVKVTGELSDNTEEYQFEKRGAGVFLEIESKRHHDDWKNANTANGDKLTIYVPVNSRVIYSAVTADLQIQDVTNATSAEIINGDIKASNLQGRIKLETVNGDIRLDNVAGELTVETVNGDISGQHTGSQDARFVTVNGDIQVDSQSALLRLESVNGKIDFNADRVTELDLITVNGAVTGRINLADNGDINGTSVGGKLDLTFNQDVSARFDMQAHAGGSIVNHLTDKQASKAKYGPNKWLEFTVGNGSARVELSTVHGKIRLAKQ